MMPYILLAAYLVLLYFTYRGAEEQNYDDYFND
jgi:hypothetical protein